MSEGMPNGQDENTELRRLIQELELQIESVNAGLHKIRGTVSRISYVALGAANPNSYTPWNSVGVGAPANRSHWSAPPAEHQTTSSGQQGDEPAPEGEASLLEASQPSPVFDPDTKSLPVSPVNEHEPGYWTSIAEGASWPRAHVEEPPAAPATSSQEWSWDLPGLEAGSEEPVPAVEDGAASALRDEAAEPEADGEVFDAGPTPEAAPAENATLRPGDMPESLSQGWPDESAWSQSFQWPASPQDEGSDVRQASDEGHIDVSHIVAKVKAEIDAARRGEIDMPSLDSGQEVEAEQDLDVTETPESSPPSESAAETGASQGELDDDARREEVSRAVAEMRAQIEAGEFDEVMRGKGPAPAEASDWHHEAPEGDPGQASAEQLGTDDDLRAEVRRAVEATRNELADEGDRPAFRLAAPGAFPDWTRIEVEPSGPPVVVMKDNDGRVELACVYETLNELGCGDGAALLNYTPHSVTVGLPLATLMPSKERMAEAVEKVFGLGSRVESDGVRITVSIGESPMQRSDAA